MGTITAGGSQYELYTLTGTVLKENSHVKSTVTGSGGGGYSYNGYGSTAPVNIQTVHTTHNQVFLVDKNGKEHAINLTNFNLDCREGHELTLVWAIKKGKETGPYIAVKNHNTGNAYYHTDSLKKMFRPTALFLLGITVFAFIIGKASGDTLTGMIYGLVALFVTNLVLAGMGNAGANSFKSSFRFDK